MDCITVVKSTWRSLGGPLAIAFAVVFALPAASVQAQTSSHGGGRQYSVRSGDTLDRIISQQIGSTPYSVVFLRDALARLNPQALPQGARGTLLAGTVMQIPDACQLRQLAFGESGGCVSETSVASDAGRTPLSAADRAELERRSWVRYP